MSRTPRSSRSLSTATQRFRASWTRWRQRRAAERLLRQQEAARQLLTPLLLEALTPVAQAMSRLSDRQQETQQWLERLTAQQTPAQAELRDLLMEVLQTLQPPAEQQIHSLLSGPPPLPSSSPSSAS